MSHVIRRVVPLVLAAACGSNPPGAGETADAAGTADAPAGDAADQPPAGRDPALDGDHDVTMTTVAIPGASANRTLAATVFVPSGGAPHPLVVISPGFQMPRAQYASYAHHLATWGFVAVLTDYGESGFFLDHQRLANDVTAVIDWALAQPSPALDATKIAAAGHSLGGKISVFAASQDARIRAVVGWDPVDSDSPSVAPQKMTAMTAAIAVAGETTNASGGGMPCAPAAENFAQFYAAAPGPALSLVVHGADHMDWVDDPSCGFCGFCTAGSAPADLARAVTRRLDVAWLRRHLLDDAAMDPWLATPPEAATGGVTITRK